MSAPFVAVCPSCSAKLKLKAAPASGKKLKCPKCEKVFAPKVPKADVDEDPWDLPDESSQSSTDEWGDEGGDAGESSYAPSRSRRVATVSRSSGSGEFPTAIVVSIVGLFALIFLGLIAGPPLMRAIANAMKPKVDPNYFISADLGIAFQLEPQRLLSMPDLPPAWRQGPEFEKTSGDLKAQIGVDIADIKAVRIAMPIPSGPPQPGASPSQDLRGQLILAKPPVFAASQPFVDIEGIRCYRDPAGKAKVLYCAGKDDTVLFAEEQTMRACLGAWKRGDNRPPEPVLPSTLLSVAMSTQPFSNQISQLQQSPFAAANPMMPALQSLQTNVKSISLGIGPMVINAGQPEEPKIMLQFFSDDDAKASAFAKSLEDALTTMNQQLGNPLMGAMLGERAEFARTVASTKPLALGRTVTVAVSLPADFLKQVVQSMPAFPTSGGGALPSFPGSSMPMSPPGGFPQAGAGAFPVSPGMSPGAMPAGAIPIGAMPPGATPAGGAHAGPPTGAIPPGVVPPGAAAAVTPPGTPAGSPATPLTGAAGPPAGTPGPTAITPSAHGAPPRLSGPPTTPTAVPGSPATPPGGSPASPPKP